MNHFVLQNKDELTYILNYFFKAKLTRKDIPQVPSNCKQELFDFACQIYKRGFLFQEDKRKEIKSTQIQVVDTVLFYNFLTELSTKKNLFYIVDTLFFSSSPQELKKLITQNEFFLLIAQEEFKNLETVFKLIQSIPNSCTHLIAIGGGITLDIAGFCAGILNLPISCVATTLLSAVDAGVGGKTGVNHPLHGKNQLGLFYSSDHFFCVPQFLNSLSVENLHAGAAEALKHSWIFGTLEEDKAEFQNLLTSCCSIKNLSEFVIKNINFKLNILHRDPFEKKNIRQVLNFGHTLAHVLEGLAESQKITPISHGIAVAYGMHFLFEQKFLPAEECPCFMEFLNFYIYNYKINILKELSLSDIQLLLTHDKKNSDSNVCTLSLPHYGQFSRSKSFGSYLKEVPTLELSRKVSNYLKSVSRY